MRPLVVAIISVLACIAIESPPARAQDAAAQALPRLEYNGGQPATLQYSGLRIVVDAVANPDFPDEKDADDDHRIPRVKGYDGERPIFSFVMDSAWHPRAQLTLRRLDPKTRVPQVVATAYTGGAHCCTITTIATSDASGAWQVVEAGRVDGDEGYRFMDLDGDGGEELVTINQRFLYAFGCYACSSSPTVILKLAGTQFVDVTRDAKYRRFLRDELKEMEKDAEWHSNGFLAGWVAQKSLVGEIDDAWPTMLRSYDRKSDWDLSCLFAEKPGECRAKKPKVSFPKALLMFLQKHGYPLPTRTTMRR